MSSPLLIWATGTLLIALLLMLLVTTNFTRSPVRSASERLFPGDYARDDDRFWIGGIIYNNPDDPEVIVPKR